MMTIEERRQLQRLMELMKEEQEKTSNIDVSNRQRDNKGRFAKEKVGESPSESVREIKLVKIKGSYGSFFVQTQWLSDRDKDILAAVGVIVLMAILF
jgi:hypothetical protein